MYDVRPHIEFSVPAWNPRLTQDVEQLKKVQENFVRIMVGLEGNIQGQITRANSHFS